MTEQELAAIEARVEAATPGPWRSRWREIGDQPREVYDQSAVVTDGTGGFELDDDGTGGQGIVVGLLYIDGHNTAVLEPDAEFIAHARQDVPALMAEVRRLQGLVQQAEWASCDGNVSGCSSACPWCEAEYVRADGTVGMHAPTCPAFGAGA